MQKRPNLAYFSQVSVLLAGIEPDFRCFPTTGKPAFLRVSSRLRSLRPWRAIDFSVLYACRTRNPIVLQSDKFTATAGLLTPSHRWRNRGLAHRTG